jgi:acyl-CoA synthetase (AMP-forming)/AMP-acid ligase II
MAEVKLIWQFVEKWANEKPDKEALIFHDRRITYKQLYEKVRTVAKLLLELGVNKGDRVFTLSAGRDEFVYTYMATSMIGAIWYGLNTRFTKDEFLYLVGDAKPKVGFVVRHHDLLKRDYKDDMIAVMQANPELKHLVVIDDPWEGALSWEKEIVKDRKNLEEMLNERIDEINEKDPTIIVYTSGTTGKPKGAVLTHKNVSSYIEVQNKHFMAANHKREEGKMLMHFPPDHAAGAIEVTMAALHWGIPIVFHDRFDPVAVLKSIEQEKITFVGQVPAMYILEFQVPNYADYDLSSVRTYVWAGSAAPESVVRKLVSTGANCMTGYGLTEATAFFTYSQTKDSVEDLVKTVGKPDPLYEVKLCDSEGNEVSRGTVGEIWFRGDLIMKGYWNRPEATAEVMTKDGWLKTGDTATMDKRGYITIVGRVKEMYKSGGYNIYPREIEQVIESDPNVALVSVIPIPDETWQEVGKAFIMPVPGKQVDIDEIRSICKKRLATYKVPKEFEVRLLLPMLPTGKINRLALVAEERKAREKK